MVLPQRPEHLADEINDLRSAYQSGLPWPVTGCRVAEQAFPARPRATVARSAGVAASALGGLLVAWAVLHLALIGAFAALVILAVSGYHAERRWTGIALERRRAAADVAQSERKLSEREAAYRAWIEKLSNIKPTDQDMAAWLDCDKKIILKSALQHYGLKRSDVISYAFLETPGTSCKRARVRNGPWRYTQYKVLVFLLTRDGRRLRPGAAGSPERLRSAALYRW